MTGIVQAVDSPEELKAKLQRWSQKLGALPNLALPTDYPRPSEQLPALTSIPQLISRPGQAR